MVQQPAGLPSRRGIPRASGLDAPDAVAEHYRSVDSAPARYALNRPASAANGFLVSFVALSMLALTAMTVLVHNGRFDAPRDLVFVAGGGQRAAVPVRLFVVLVFVAFGLNIAANWWRRLAMIAELLGWLVVLSMAIDLGAWLADRFLDLTAPVVGQQIVSTLLALAVFPFVVLHHVHLPEPDMRPMTGRIRWHAWVRLIVPLVIAFVVAALVEQRLDVLVKWMREVALLGGVGPGVFLVQQLFAVMTAAIGLVMISRSRRASFAPPLAVLVPAHNEAHDINETIAAVDRAAAAYGGSVRICVVDNLSTDNTVDVARAAIDSCRHLSGEVVECAVAGKAVALNYGLDRITEPFVVRIDADTIVGEKCLDLALRHFTRPDVGVVGGMPLPTGRDTYFDRVRLVEVMIRHGFFQVSRMGYDGILGEPGMFVVYRRAALDLVGPIVQGMNGEDTDICLRMNSVGFRSLAEPRAAYYSETPRTWAHMREQRVRWFRSAYHLAGHNKRAIFSRSSMAGAVVLPFLLVNAARRALLTPLLLYAVLVFTVFSATFPGLRWQPVLATVLGLPMLVAVGVCLGQRRPRAVLYVPEYLLFRLVRSYFTGAAVLSLVFPPLDPVGAVRRRIGSSRRR